MIRFYLVKVLPASKINLLCSEIPKSSMVTLGTSPHPTIDPIVEMARTPSAPRLVVEHDSVAMFHTSSTATLITVVVGPALTC